MTGHPLPAGYLQLAGSSIVGADGNSVRLAGVNWYGMDCDANCVGGLDKRHRSDICSLIVDLGFNLVRLPFTVEGVLTDPAIDNRWLTANTDLIPAGGHATYLGIMDAVVTAAGGKGLKVLLDCHRSFHGWSTQENGLWYAMDATQRVWTTQDWMHAWTSLVTRYAADSTVIGCDLRNELSDNQNPRQTDEQHWPYLAGSQWGSGAYRRDDATGTSSDWRQAATDCGNAILAQNADLLIFVEGVRSDPSGPASNHNVYWPGGNLTGVLVRGQAITLNVDNRLVYSVHDYGPNAGAVAWCQLTPTNTAKDDSACHAVWDQTWGNIVQQGIAPIWIGEFGTPNGRRPGDTNPPATYTDPNNANAQGAWFTYLVEYIGQHNLHWCYWALNGSQSAAPGRNPSNPDWYGILDPAWGAVASDPMMAKLQTIQ